jgi:hypothetical protein
MAVVAVSYAYFFSLCYSRRNENALMTAAQAFREVESAAHAYANGAEPGRVQRIHEALAALRAIVADDSSKRPPGFRGTRPTESPQPHCIDPVQPTLI